MSARTALTMVRQTNVLCAVLCVIEVCGEIIAVVSFIMIYYYLLTISETEVIVSSGEVIAARISEAY